MNNGKCEEGYMKCQRNGYCISDTMICNDVANCGENDDSDERDCDSHHRRSTDSDCKYMLRETVTVITADLLTQTVSTCLIRL